MSSKSNNAAFQMMRVLRNIAAAFSIIKMFPVIIPAAALMLIGEMNLSGINNVTISAYLNGLPQSIIDPTTKKLLIGGIASTFLLAETLFRIPGGWLSDRYGRARIITFSMLLSAPSFLLSGLAPSFWWFFPLRAWDGIMAAAIFISIFAIIGDAVPERCRANAMGVINAMYMFGLLAGYTVAGTIDTITNNPRIFLFISASVALCAGILSFFFFSRRTELNAPHPEVETEDLEKNAVPGSHHAVLLGITFAQNLALTTIGPFMYLYVKTELVSSNGSGSPLGQIALLVGGPILGVAIFAIPLSRLADKIGKVMAVRLAFTLVASTLWIFSVTKELWLLSFAATTVGVAFSLGIPAWLAIISSLASSKKRGVILGGYGTVQGIAAVIGPLVGAFVWAHFGLPRIFDASAILVAIAAALSWIALPESLGNQKTSIAPQPE